MSRLHNDDRAVSIAVTHVLTIAVTTLIIGGLMMGASFLMEVQTERSAEESLETIGERLSSQLSGVDRATADGGEATVRATHPRTVAGAGYTVDLTESCDDQPLLEDVDQCLILTHGGSDVEVGVPVKVNQSVSGEASGGTIEITGDGSEIEIESGSA